jgi:hypothetical protein
VDDKRTTCRHNANEIAIQGYTPIGVGNLSAMDHTDDSAVWCPICGEPAEDVQVSTEDGWSRAATHLVTVRACTNTYCEGYHHHPAIWQRGVWSLVRITTG